MPEYLPAEGAVLRMLSAAKKVYIAAKAPAMPG